MYKHRVEVDSSISLMPSNKGVCSEKHTQEKVFLSEEKLFFSIFLISFYTC